MRARYPDLEGHLDRDGVNIFYEVYDNPGPTLLLVPSFSITHSRMWKGLIPYLSRHFRVVTLDGRGNGKADRVTDPALFADDLIVDDLAAVLEATETQTAVAVGHCHANSWLLSLINAHPEKVGSWIAIEPGVPFIAAPQPHYVEAFEHWEEIPESPQGWELCNRHVWLNDYQTWIEFFFGAQLIEPHSTKQWEDAVGWALETTGEVQVAEEDRYPDTQPTESEIRELIDQVSCPVLVIHGEEDVCQSVDRGRALAEMTGGELVVMEGVGHLPQAREPVQVSLAIREFVERITGGAMKSQVWTRGMSRQKRILYISSPIGLGHARRDVSIAKELKKLRPEVEIDWLAQHPVTEVLEAEEETIHPASEWLASESAHIASEAGEHDLHCFQALRRMDEILVANFMIFQEVVEEGLYDLVIGDEAWDIDYYWHENPELKRGNHVWLTDFVGFIPIPAGGEREAYLTADYNAEMIEHIARYPRIRDRAIFVGNPDDIVPELFGPGLPKIKDWTEEHFDFSGYVTGFTPLEPDQIAEWRERLGYRDDEKVCIVTVGGSGVGRDLIERLIAAYPMAKRLVPELRMVVVAGPRIEPESLTQEPGVEILGYVDRLYRHLSVCDLAVVQGGLTTTMELTAAKRPFLYFPLREHFEQNYHVRYRLDQYGAGIHMDYGATEPDQLAEVIAREIGYPVVYRDVESDGAERAASMIAELI
jgi:pimeloyl-ACP methyl ester carboxylesterase/predicted glycosyltransferase